MGPAEVILASGIVAAVVGALAGFLTARFQRTWDLDARMQQDRRDRIRAAVDVLLRFLDVVEDANRRPLRPVSYPFETLTARDWWYIASVSRLLGPSALTREEILYPVEFLTSGGKLPDGNVSAGLWDPVKVHASMRVAKLTAELELLGDKDLRNFK